LNASRLTIVCHLNGCTHQLASHRAGTWTDNYLDCRIRRRRSSRLAPPASADGSDETGIAPLALAQFHEHPEQRPDNTDKYFFGGDIKETSFFAEI